MRCCWLVVWSLLLALIFCDLAGCASIWDRGAKPPNLFYSTRKDLANTEIRDITDMAPESLRNRLKDSAIAPLDLQDVRDLNLIEPVQGRWYAVRAIRCAGDNEYHARYSAELDALEILNHSRNFPWFPENRVVVLRLDVQPKTVYAMAF